MYKNVTIRLKRTDYEQLARNAEEEEKSPSGLAGDMLTRSLRSIRLMFQWVIKTEKYGAHAFAGFVYADNPSRALRHFNKTCPRFKRDGFKVAIGEASNYTDKEIAKARAVRVIGEKS